jgi:methylmalonyl-CoA mutase N-terminal domain/subunit
MLREEEFRKIEEAREKWEGEVLTPALKRFDAEKSHNRYYTPLDIKDLNYLEKVGLPGSFPFTGGIYPCVAPERIPSAGRGSELASGKGLIYRRIGFG